MRYKFSAFLLAILVGCSSRPTPQEVMLRADGTAMVGGAPMSDEQLFDLAMSTYRRHGTFPLTIRSDESVPLGRLAHVADVYRRAGVWRISTASARPDAAPLLYPTFQTWTNEWKWHDYFDESGPIMAIKTNAGVNVRILPDGAQIETTLATMPQLLDRLASLAGSDRARVVITADTNTPHSSLMAVLEACEKHAVDPLFVEHWEAEQAESTVTSEAAPSASSDVR